MRSISITEAREDFESVLDAAQEERVLITRAGKAIALLVGIELYDEEDLILAGSPEFWRLIEQRRHGKSVPHRLANEFHRPSFPWLRHASYNIH